MAFIQGHSYMRNKNFGVYFLKTFAVDLDGL